MRRLFHAAPLVVCALTLFAHPAAGQTPAGKPDPTLRDVLLKHWSEIGDKVVKMAEDFPEDKYEFKPNPAVRSFADNLRHVAFWNDYVAKSARGEKADAKQNELSKAQYATKAAEGQLRRRDRATQERTGDATHEARRSLGLLHRALGRALRTAGRILPPQRPGSTGISIS
jgi:hypothetical protein